MSENLQVVQIPNFFAFYASEILKPYVIISNLGNICNENEMENGEIKQAF